MGKSKWKDRPGVLPESCGCRYQITKANDRPIRNRINPCQEHWKEVAKAECARSGHLLVPIKDCDDWPWIKTPGESCACLLVGTDARACSRCRDLIIPRKP